VWKQQVQQASNVRLNKYEKKERESEWKEEQFYNRRLSISIQAAVTACAIHLNSVFIYKYSSQQRLLSTWSAFSGDRKGENHDDLGKIFCLFVAKTISVAAGHRQQAGLPMLKTFRWTAALSRKKAKLFHLASPTPTIHTIAICPNFYNRSIHF
jgi:hypothetical protein